jgi:CubicO group peptidase (beta-lactamase class C family)
VPGASWAIIDGGEIAQTGAAGVREAGQPEPIGPETLFQACSISKPIAVCAMLRLGSRSVRGRRGREPTVDNVAGATARRVATGRHAQAIGEPQCGPDGPRVSRIPPRCCTADGRTDPRRRPACHQLRGAGRHHSGTQFRYAGGRTMVLQLLEDLTGTPFRELVRELVLDPLELSNSDYAQPLPPERVASAAVAHDQLGRPIDGLWHTSPELAAAGLWTTPTDLVRFAIAVQRAYAGEEDALLSPELAREALTTQMPASERIGGLDHLGLGLIITDEGRRFGHSGGNEGFKCHLLAYRDTGQGAAVMTNGENGAWVTQRAFAAIARVHGWPSYPEGLDDRVVPTTDEFERLAGRYRIGSRTYVDLTPAGVGFDATFQGQRDLSTVARMGE